MSTQNQSRLQEIANHIDQNMDRAELHEVLLEVRAMLDKGMIEEHAANNFSHGHVRIRTSSDNRLYNAAVAENGESLSHSETLNDHPTAVNNILAHLNLFGGSKVRVVDESEGKEFILHADGNVYYKLS